MKKEQDSAGLIGQPIPDVAGTEPRLTGVRRMDTQEARDFWKFVDTCSERVQATYPSWALVSKHEGGQTNYQRYSTNALEQMLRHARATLVTVSQIAPGYDWNSDPKYLTQLIGDTFNQIDALIGSHDNQSLNEASVSDPIDKRATGVYRKFVVTRTDGQSAPGEKHEGCEYFVLDLDHDPHAYDALCGYINSCQRDYPALAYDLSSKLTEKKFGSGHQVTNAEPAVATHRSEAK